MMLRGSLVPAGGALAALILLSGCQQPDLDPATLKSIKAEAQMLMKVYPISGEVAKARLPRAIARLNPQLVLINAEGIHITTKAYFDGGWGYFVPRNERTLPEPAQRFDEVGQGVYWWHPY